jgi:hypothetical protein
MVQSGVRYRWHKEKGVAMHKVEMHDHANGGGAVYGLGLIGAIVFYWSNASTLVEFLLGFLKALVWPAFLVYEAFSALL